MFRKTKSKLAVLLSMALCVSMITGMGSTVFADDTSSKADGATGKKLTENEFNSIYCSPDYSFNSSKLRSVPVEADLTINNASISETTANLSLEIMANSISSDLSISGDLYAGYKQQDGRNSIVGDMVSDNNNFEVMLFEIFDDTANDTLLVNPSLNGTPHLKIYLKTLSDEVLLFETALPSGLSDASYNASEQINSFKDVFWFIGIAEPYESEELPVDDEMIQFMGIEEETSSFAMPRSTVIKSWTDSKSYYKSFYIGPDLYKCYSLANGNMNMPNQIGASAPWTSTFQVAEHTTINGTTYRSVDNPFQFQNVSLKMSASNSVTFVNSTVAGTIVDTNGNPQGSGDSIYALLFDYACDYIPFGSTISAAQNLIDLMDQDNSTTISLGALNADIYGPITPSIGYGMDSYQEVHKNTSTANGHSVKLQGTSASLVTGSSVTGYALMETTYDVYYMGDSLGGDLQNSAKITNNLRYVAS